MESHLLQMRGLKLVTMYAKVNNIDVASFTDAWIETSGQQHQQEAQKSHLLQMRGLKHFLSNAPNSYTVSHLLQMRGLKHTFPFILFKD